MTAEQEVKMIVGETLTRVHGMERGSGRVVIEAASGRTFVMMHHQDCCESVEIEDVTGDVADLVGSPILKAEESSNSDGPRPDHSDDSWTWTFYHFATVKGYVTLRWLGSSNGYYSEGVSFDEQAAVA